MTDGACACDEAVADVAAEQGGQAPAARPMRDGRFLVLAADVGGTHARLGLLGCHRGEQGVVLDMLAYQVFSCREHASLDAIVRRFCEQHAVQPRRFALACAGLLQDGRVINSHLAWPIEPAHLQATLAMDDVRVLNDFVALAHAVPHLPGHVAGTLHAPMHPSAGGPVVVVGPGTGLGVAVRLPGTPAMVLPTEAGHIQLAARTVQERCVLAALAPDDAHVPYDHVLSGPGLLRVYQVLCRLAGIAPSRHAPAEVVAGAVDGSDAQASEALEIFSGWLGSYVGDLAMLYGASGGIYLAGGFLARIIDFLAASRFVERFLDKGVMRPFLERVPVHVVDHSQLGVVGAASWLVESAAA